MICSRIPCRLSARLSFRNVLTLAAVVVAPNTYAATILDASYFATRPHTLVTFEERGNGTATPTANATLLPPAEYAALGFTIAPGLSSGVAWVNDPSADVDAAQAIGGSPQLAIAATDNQGDFFIHFSPRSVTAFGFWMQHRGTRPGVPALDALGATGILESASFSRQAIDGAVGPIDYGFLGIASAEPISSIHVRGDIALLDNFMFVAVPEPATSGVALSAVLALAVVRMSRQQ